MGGAPPKNQQEVYAREQVLIAAEPERELKLQAIRIGDLGITAIPNEVFGITGLKIKAQSPLGPTFNIELANGAEGYIPPPEQHALGGYTTWPARTAGLEVNAEPKIVEAVLALLEKVTGKDRRAAAVANGAYAKAILAAKPLAYWRGEEFSGREARDATGRGNHGVYGGGVVFYLEGPASPVFSAPQVNRAPHFAGGHMRAVLPALGDRYSVELWFENGLPADARPVTGYLFCRGADCLGLAADRLFFAAGDTRITGTTPVGLRTWNHAVLVRDRDTFAVHLNGGLAPEISGTARTAPPDAPVLIGGRHDGAAGFEGRIDEIAVFNRPLAAREAARHYVLARVR